MKYYRYGLFLFLGILFGFCMTTNLYAVSAYPRLIEIKQPDGYMLKVRMTGDEFQHKIETEDGYTLLYDNLGFLSLAIPDESGDIQPSRFRIRNIKDREPIIEQQLRLVGKHVPFSDKQKSLANSRRAQTMSIRRIMKPQSQVVGERRYLVVLMEFPDKKFLHTVSEFDALLNETGYGMDGNQGSVRDYFRENSFGQLDLVCDVVGVNMAKHEMAYYGNNTNGVAEELAIEAVEAVSQKCDLKQYDSDGDGMIDGLHIIFAGYGEESGGGANCIWSHEYNNGGVLCSVDGIKVCTYSCSPEMRGSFGSNLSFIGVICHEIGHALGTPDFYDTDYASSGGQYDGAGNWDVMANGSWNGDGACPAHFNPYTKIYDFQWSSVEDGNKSFSAQLSPKTQGQFIRIDTQTEGEFFLLEYRHQSGFDKMIPGHGLMVWRATDNLSKRNSNNINASHKQQFYPLSGTCTDYMPEKTPSSYGDINSSNTPFGGSGSKTELTDETYPSMRSWDGIKTEFPITNIEESEPDLRIFFDINGGNMGRAYGFSIIDRTVNSLQMVWNVPNTETKVLLLRNTENKFGNLELETYEVGQILNEGEEVVYIGCDTSFIDNNLKDHTMYYYRICTWQEDSKSWYAGITCTGKTKADAITSFPYAEDFESQVLDDSWDEEAILGQDNYWKVNAEVTYIGNTNYVYFDNYLLSFGPTDFKHQSSRIVLPVMNLKDKKNARLSFDYRNGIDQGSVMYRTSPDAPWKLLGNLYSEIVSGSNGMGLDHNYLKTRKKHMDLMLPELSKEYQICFVGYFSPTGNSMNAMQQLLIDNIRIETDNPVYATTLDVTSVGSSFARANYSITRITDQPVENGIEYSKDQKEWIRVLSDSNTCVLTGLADSTTYYYRSFATCASTTHYGVVKSFKTATGFSGGSGSKDDPYQISSLQDWMNFRTTIGYDNTLKDVHFILKTDLTLSANQFIDNIFCGKLDGDGHTISYNAKGILMYFFNYLGSEAEICNLYFTTGTLVDRNRGFIHDCEVNFDQDFQKEEFRSFGFIANTNIGIIRSCKVSVKSISVTRANIGGVCHQNHGLITDCSFDGNITANNNSWLGGIASSNSRSNGDVGIISRCISSGTLSIVKKQGRAYVDEVGGIAGYSAGVIDQCVNRCEIYAECSDNKYDYMIDVGGIAGSIQHNQATITNCYNEACITTDLSGSSNSCGGIVGEAYIANMNNCFSVGNVIIKSGSPLYYRVLVGNNSMSVIKNCYYTESAKYDDVYYEDGNGTKVSLEEIRSSEFLKNLNDKTDIPVWVAGLNHPELQMEPGHCSVYIPLVRNVTTTGGTIRGIVTGDFSSCGFEWREKYTSTWNKLPQGNDGNIRAELTNLSSATLYEYRVYVNQPSGVCYSAPIVFATLFESKGTIDDPVVLSSYYDLETFRQTVHQGNNYGNMIVRLDSDIDLMGNKGVLWQPITEKNGMPFSGEFDGNGHFLINMKVSIEGPSAGFFGTTGRCYVHDLTILNGDITSSQSVGLTQNLSSSTYQGGVGGIIGDCISYDIDVRPIIERCCFKGIIEGGNYIGGLIGNALDNEIKDSYAIADLRFVREADKNYTNAPNPAKIGGITGYGNVTNCYFVGSISAPTATSKQIGRLVASAYGCWVNNSYYSEPLPEDDEENSVYGTKLSLAEMKNGKLLSKLPKNIWTADGLGVNDNLPILKSQGAPHVWIYGYELKEPNTMTIRGGFFGSGEKYEKRGFQYSYDPSNASIVSVTSLPKDIKDGVFSADISYKQGEYIVVRAFARENESRVVYSDWVVLGENGLMPDDVKGVVNHTNILTSDCIFDLQGRKVDGSSVSSLRKGLYIINNKKVVIK